MRRSVAFLLTLTVVLLAANLVVQLARPAQAQLSDPAKLAPYVVGIAATDQVVCRLWSDGSVDCNDPRNLTNPVNEMWKGWVKLVK